MPHGPIVPKLFFSTQFRALVRISLNMSKSALDNIVDALDV
jgi:hypothetical protein